MSPLIGVTYSSDELDEFLLWRRMFQGVVAAGGTPLAIDCAGPHQDVSSFISRLDGLIISGGGDVDPARYGGNTDDPLIQGVNRDRDVAELEALETARRLGMPILAICRGAQLVNVACGGTLYADLARDAGAGTEPGHRRSEETLANTLHSVDVAEGSLLAKWLEQGGTLDVNSQHHQGIRALAPGLVVSATSPDGLIEGFEVPAEHLVGVQWHPEVLWPTVPHALALLTNFVTECSTHHHRALSQEKA